MKKIAGLALALSFSVSAFGARSASETILCKSREFKIEVNSTVAITEVPEISAVVRSSFTNEVLADQFISNPYSTRTRVDRDRNIISYGHVELPTRLLAFGRTGKDLFEIKINRDSGVKVEFLINDGIYNVTCVVSE